MNRNKKTGRTTAAVGPVTTEIPEATDRPENSERLMSVPAGESDKPDRRRFLKMISACLMAVTPAAPILSAMGGCSRSDARNDDNSEELYVSSHFTAPGTFVSGIEGPVVDGPAVDRHGNLYAVNYQHEQTIGVVSPEGDTELFIELPHGSTGGGIRFTSRGEMLIADTVHQNILKIDLPTKTISVYAHQPDMNMPNDLAIGANDIVYASDPDWNTFTGKLWRVDTDGSTTLLEENMGTTNGIEVGADERTLYVNESVQRNVWAYDLSSRGEISNKRLLIRFPDYGIDGMRCDADGNLYITRKGRGRTVVIISPAGEVIQEITLSGGWIANNLAFGGPDGRTVYVTVADRGNIQMFRTASPGRSWALVNR